MPRIRFARTALLATVAALGFAGSAHADTALKPIGYTTLPAPNSDCMVHTYLMRGSGIYASGNTYCSNRKATTTTTTTLKFNTANWETRSTSFTNSFGMLDRWLNTGQWNGCGNWQAVTSTTVTDSYGRQSSAYATSGSPLYTC